MRRLRLLHAAMAQGRGALRGLILGALLCLAGAASGHAAILDVTDPTGDDNGPGTFQYPTASDFKPGAFDITRFQIFDDGTTVYFLLQTGDLSPTFGNPLGAQLVDVFLHNPTAAVTSTSAPFASRNFSIAPADAWSSRIEVQGFAAPVFVDASGTNLGAVAVSTDAATRTIEFSVPVASLGDIAAGGWSVVVTLTGQDGFSADEARGFVATPQDFLFAVCPAGGGDSICAASPATMPKIIDTLTPLGISQATELNPTLGPVVLEGIDIPAGGTLGAPGLEVPEPASGMLLGAGLLGLFAAGFRSTRARATVKPAPT